jgi:geranylgeranyl pyrophosphate synthase
MFYLEKADEASREEVRRVIEGTDRSDELVAATIRKINASDALGRANEVATRFIDEAKASLAGFADIPARQSLLDLADFAIQRAY